MKHWNDRLMISFVRRTITWMNKMHSISSLRTEAEVIATSDAAI